MTVVINEFEVVPEAAPAEDSPVAAESSAPTALSAPEVERVLLHLAERTMRVEAH